MRWLITGAGGMLAADVLCRTALTGEPVLALGRADLDVRDRRAVHDFVSAYRPRAVLNCAAWTAVDDAETHEAEALAVNGDAARWLAEACDRIGARLVHVSTDYVFDGAAGPPYTEDAPTGPVNAYGRTKLAGERAVLELGHYVVRTAWLYGAHGANFATTMIRLAGERPILDVVDDQHGQPTWTADLADYLVRLAQSDLPPGVYHGTSAGRRPGAGSPGRSSRCWARTRSGCARCRPRPSPPGPAPGQQRAGAHPGEPIRHWRAALHAAWPVLSRSRQCSVA
ncbi:dTDP-4-dehydrorhamnose reductase [Nonomuraea thailandensis]